MYNIQKYRVPKNSQCLKGSDYSLHDRSNSTPGKLHRRAPSLTSQGTELKTDQSQKTWLVWVIQSEASRLLWPWLDKMLFRFGRDNFMILRNSISCDILDDTAYSNTQSCSVFTRRYCVSEAGRRNRISRCVLIRPNMCLTSWGGSQATASRSHCGALSPNKPHGWCVLSCCTFFFKQL